MRNRQFVFAPKIEYELVAESRQKRGKRREANRNRLQIPYWCGRRELNPHAIKWPGASVLCVYHCTTSASKPPINTNIKLINTNVGD